MAILKCMRIYLYHIILCRVYINYANYICAILVLLAHSHKYSARINNRLYGIPTCLSSSPAPIFFAPTKDFFIEKSHPHTNGSVRVRLRENQFIK